jgi:lipopolysaccharide/colanic/teichoic acid biosynthesis glycosyltransferase
MVKRLFDFIISLIGIVLLSPVIAVLSILVKVSSPGTVFFRQRRVGFHGKIFYTLKFRTMAAGSEKSGSITAATDGRITSFGRFLRRYKLDEIPQLMNVLSGAMSFVGPRPDVPGYADILQGENRKILELRPGITGPASLFFRYEEDVLAQVENVKEYNDTVIWPIKVKLNIQYYKQRNIWKDIGYILITIAPCLNKVLKLVQASPHTPKELDQYAAKL